MHIRALGVKRRAGLQRDHFVAFDRRAARQIAVVDHLVPLHFVGEEIRLLAARSREFVVPFERGPESTLIAPPPIEGVDMDRRVICNGRGLIQRAAGLHMMAHRAYRPVKKSPGALLAAIHGLGPFIERAQPGVLLADRCWDRLRQR